MTTPLSPQLEKLRRWYVASAVLLLNVVLLAAVFGGLYALVRTAKQKLADRARVSPVEKKYGDRIFKAYPDLSRDDTRALLWETWTRPCVFEPYTQFKERPFSGRFVNVSEHGFRRSQEQAAWPPDTNAFNVFVFGGSTTFGYGVADDQTVASYLQTWLRTNTPQRVNVYNFGRAYYFSTQEMVLFQRLLSGGHVPRLAIFLDGLNDAVYVDDQPAFTDQLGRAMESKPGRRSVAGSDSSRKESKQLADEVVRRYEVNRSMIKTVADAFDVQVAFVWQPVPTYQYDLQFHQFQDDNFKRHPHARTVYEVMNNERGKLADDQSFVWCADLQEGVTEPLYLDEVHYTPRLNRMLAERIGQTLQVRGFLTLPRQPPPAEVAR